MQEKLPFSFFSETRRKKNTFKNLDRFISARPATENDYSFQEAQLGGAFDGPADPHKEALAQALWGFSYRDGQSKPILNVRNYTSVETRLPKSNKPYRLEHLKALDTPGLSKDFYASPLCWGEHFTYIGLNDTLYSLNHHYKSTKIKQDASNAQITSIGSDYRTLVMAMNNQKIALLDTRTNRQYKEISVQGKVNKIISKDPHIFYLLSQRKVVLYDRRTPQIMPIIACTHDMPGMDFNPNKSSLAVSSEEAIQLFDVRNMTRPSLSVSAHKDSGCKALAFSPGSGQYIASGGGVADMELIIWDTRNGIVQDRYFVDEQLCNVHWLNETSLFTTEGYSSNRVACWSFIEKKLTLERSTEEDTRLGHHDRVLFSAQNPRDKTKIVTGSTNDRIIFWSAGDARRSQKEKENIDWNLGPELR